MKKLSNELVDICKKLDGKLILVGHSDLLQEVVNNNINITHCDILSSLGGDGKDKTIFKRGKKVTSKKLKSHYHKKRVDNMIVDYKHIEKTIKHFIPSSLYITKKNIYITVLSGEVDKFKKLYKRYTSKVKVTNFSDEALITINAEDVKINYFKEKYYIIIDTLNNIIDYISEFLIN